MRDVRIFDHKDELNRAAARLFADAAAQAIRDRGRFTVALSGGSTPRALYELLASGEVDVEWREVFFFFGDERPVPHTSPESNSMMARNSLLSPLKIADGNIFAWETALVPEEAALDYEQRIISFFGLPDVEPRPDRDWPEFDLALLGMGADGHTASLFPGSPALSEIARIAVANYVEKLDSERLTLTFPVFNSSRMAVFLVAGEEKSEVLHEVIDGEFRPDELPAQLIQPADGELIWLLDRAAASRLDR